MRHLGPRMPCPSPCMARLQGNVPLGPACSTLITSDRDWVSTVQGRLCTPERTESGVREDEMASHLGASSTDATCQVHRLEKNNIAGHGPQRKGGGGRKANNRAGRTRCGPRPASGHRRVRQVKCQCRVVRGTPLTVSGRTQLSALASNHSTP